MKRLVYTFNMFYLLGLSLWIGGMFLLGILVEIPFTYFDGSGGGAECGDGECNGDETEESCPEDCSASGGTVSINYNSDTAIAGFQFAVDPSVTVTAAAGGAAEAAGFMISTGNNTVVAFSLTGDWIPAGSGVLVELTIEGDVGEAVQYLSEGREIGRAHV